MKKNYLQFSKKMVILTMIMVNVMMFLCLVCMMTVNDLSAMAATMKAYLTFAAVVFVAYCGNSAIEKAAIAWATSKAGTSDDDDDDTS